MIERYEYSTILNENDIKLTRCVKEFNKDEVEELMLSSKFIIDP